jgi:PadR family transcriptional regulator, regulatory protein PadR
MCGMEAWAGLATAMRRGTLEFCVLALLESEPRYGVELVSRLAARDALTTTEGTLYPLLARLRRAGWVATTWQESPAGPPRRYYELTGRGKEALAHFRSEWVAFRTAVDDIVGTEHT